MKKIVILGGGVLGSQIAFQTAYSGFNVSIWVRTDESVKKSKERIKKLKETYIETIKLMSTNSGKTFEVWGRAISDIDNFNKKECLKKVEIAFENIKFDTSLKDIVKDADLVIESMIEDINIKRNMYITLSSLLPEKTILTTNSSTILPSKLSKYTKREDKFLALHFANSIWRNNTAEVMSQQKTSNKSFDQVIKFAKQIGMIPLPIKKEKSGYLLNSMLIPFLFSGLDLYVNGYSDPKSIDKAWTMGTGAPKGPFKILDTVGLKTAYNIVLMYTKIPSFLAPYNFKEMEKLLKKYIDKGKLGVESGEGFYKYKKKGN